MNCSNCGSELTADMFSSGMCFSCGQPVEESEQASKLQEEHDRLEQKKSEEARKEKELEEAHKKRLLELQHIKEINDIYEYDIDIIGDEKNGMIKTDALKHSLETHSKNGWHLCQSFSNELGINGASMNITGGFRVEANQTMEATILVYERIMEYSMLHKALLELGDKHNT